MERDDGAEAEVARPMFARCCATCACASVRCSSSLRRASSLQGGGTGVKAGGMDT